MTRERWIFLLVLIIASYMIFDGSRALIYGDYLTPSAGSYSGQLGSWASIVSLVGIEPRSMFMKLAFVAYGFSMICMGVFFVMKFRWARLSLLTMAVLGLWYLPFGTIINLIVIFLLATKKG
ncbi:MAG: hypothetical protein JNM55_01990 [Anaerolineales bacterium]|nr:hypothetical protein [Anaerolineales bacterium]